MLRLPIAHKEGNWFAAARGGAPRSSRPAWWCSATRPPTARSTDVANPNGALNDIAGLSNREGNVIGLMPHPERRIHPLLGGDDGLGLIRGLVEAA